MLPAIRRVKASNVVNRGPPLQGLLNCLWFCVCDVALKGVPQAPAPRQPNLW